MDTQHHQKLKEHLEKSQQVGIVVRPNPTIDHMGAALGLYLSLKQAGKQVAIASPTETLVEISNLVGIDKVKKSLATDGGDIIVAFPYKEGDVEKVSYNIENGFFNIIVRAAEEGLQFHEKEVQFKRGGKPLHLLVTIGVPRLNDISSVLGDLHKNAIVVNIDNRGDNQNYGDVVIVSQKFSSLSEQIADFLTLPEAGLPLDQDIAQNLLSGITYATNDFQDPKTSHLAFEMAGILMRKGAVRKKLQTEERKPQQQFTPRPQQSFVTQQRPVQSTPIVPAAPRVPSQPQQVTQPTPQPRPIQPATQQPPFVPPTPRPQPVQVPQQQQSNPRPASQPIAQSPVQPNVQPVQSQPSSAQPSTQAPQSIEQTNQMKEAPADWLQPKVYKGSTIME